MRRYFPSRRLTASKCRIPAIWIRRPSGGSHPLRAPGHQGLPPALIQIARHDPLYDQGLLYATALRDAGVPVILTAYPAMPHGYINMPYLCRDSGLAMREIIDEQRKYLHRD